MTISMLCCLLLPDAGSAQALGRDVSADPLGGNSVIAVAPQETAVAEHLTGTGNLRLMAGLHGLPTDRAKVHSTELLEVLGLSARAGQKARKCSGGLKRRLSIAMALVSDPEVLFLDELTHGLASLTGTMTILLTTHCLEEADALADRIAITGIAAWLAGNALLNGGAPAIHAWFSRASSLRRGLPASNQRSGRANRRGRLRRKARRTSQSRHVPGTPRSPWHATHMSSTSGSQSHGAFGTGADGVGDGSVAAS